MKNKVLTKVYLKNIPICSYIGLITTSVQFNRKNGLFTFRYHEKGLFMLISHAKWEKHTEKAPDAKSCKYQVPRNLRVTKYCKGRYTGVLGLKKV